MTQFINAPLLYTTSATFLDILELNKKDDKILRDINCVKESQFTKSYTKCVENGDDFEDILINDYKISKNGAERIIRAITSKLRFVPTKEPPPQAKHESFYDTKANRRYYYACITGLPLEGNNKKIVINSEDELQKLERSTFEHPFTLQDKNYNTVYFFKCNIGPLTEDGTRVIEHALYRAENLLGRTGSKKGRKFKVIELRKVAPIKIEKATFSKAFPKEQSMELVEFANNGKRVYLDVFNDKKVQMDPATMTDYEYKKNIAAGLFASVVFGGQTYSVFDVFVTKSGGRRDIVAVDNTTDDSVIISRNINNLRVHNGKLTEEELSTIKTLYGVSADFDYDSCTFKDLILDLVFKKRKSRSAKKARINAMFIDKTLAFLKI